MTVLKYFVVVVLSTTSVRFSKGQFLWVNIYWDWGGLQRLTNLLWKIQVLSFQKSPIWPKSVKDFIMKKPLQNIKFCTFFPQNKISLHKAAHLFSNLSNFFRAAFFWRLFRYENIDQFESSWCHLKAKNLNFPNQVLLSLQTSSMPLKIDWKKLSLIFPDGGSAILPFREVTSVTPFLLVPLEVRISRDTCNNFFIAQYNRSSYSVNHEKSALIFHGVTLNKAAFHFFFLSEMKPYVMWLHETLVQISRG